MGPGRGRAEGGGRRFDAWKSPANFALIDKSSVAHAGAELLEDVTADKDRPGRQFPERTISAKAVTAAAAAQALGDSVPSHGRLPCARVRRHQHRLVSASMHVTAAC